MMESATGFESSHVARMAGIIRESWSPEERERRSMEIPVNGSPIRVTRSLATVVLARYCGRGQVYLERSEGESTYSGCRIEAPVDLNDLEAEFCEDFGNAVDMEEF